ncbi:MAG: EamA family transporter [Chloroflexi bacterium]|nr:EamA family transporter [Chloroflexota bacterium]
MLRHSPYLRAVLQALFVTFLWSTSWVLIKIGLEDIPALTFAGLRYVLAFLVLLPFVLRPGQLDSVRQLTRRDWLGLAVLGLIYYAITPGTQFLGLDRLPAITTSLLLSFSAVVIAVLGVILLAETLTRRQWSGIVIYLIGALVYFYPVEIPTREVLGLIIVLGGVLATSLATVLGRGINRAARIPPLTVTVVSMGVGAIVLLIVGIATQGLPALSLQSWAIIGWLAVVNTALTYTLWNHTQRTLSAAESGIINNTMLIQIALLAWIFLGESLTLREIGGLALAALGTLIVQLRRRTPATVPVEEPAAVAAAES